MSGTISADGVDIKFLIHAEDSDGQATAFVTDVAPGGNTLAAHSHAWEETMYVIAGSLTFVIDGETRVVDAGDAVYIAKDSVHKYENLTDTTASMLIVSTPGLNHESYFDEVAGILNSPDATDSAIKSVMDNYGVIPAT